jgi:hypothetical protein
MPACSEFHEERSNTLCEQNVEFFMLNLVILRVTAGFKTGIFNEDTIHPV